ncbi:hypothetical protein GTW29_24685 [Streptomyces sp. SID7834]|nr:hypothetical protein [Streptomyces sp. SID7834]MYT59871.1 hypothetical protein [Streptomyces sp. SID7834]
MIGEESAVDPQDNEAIKAFEAALTAFAEELTLLHIASGSPSYATIASASVRSRLTKSGLTEMLTGKRLPSHEALLEFVRVVTTPSGLDKPTAAKFRADPNMAQEWRDRWQHVKVLQRQAQRAKKRLRTADKQVHDDTSYEPESLQAEAEQTRTSEDASCDDTCTTTQQEALGDVTAEEYVCLVEATFNTSIPKEARVNAWVAGSLVGFVTICSVALAWAGNSELFVKIMYSAIVPMMPWTAALADITDRTKVLDARRQVVLIYLLAAGIMAGPAISYLEGQAEGPLPVQILAYAVMLATTTIPLALLSGAVDGLFPELEDEVKDLIRGDRARVEQLNADKRKAIQRARSWRRYYELQGEPLGSPPQPGPREDAPS